MRHLLVTVLVFGLLAFAACGGDDSGGLSKKDYIAQADAICKKANQSETDAGAAGATGEIEKRVLEAVVAIDRDAVAKVRTLEVPQEDADKVKKIVSDLAAVHATRRDQLAAVRSGDGRAESKAQNAFFTASSDLGASAGAYGLTWCQALGY